MTLSFTKILLSYLLTALVFFAIDMAWLGLIAKKIYQKYLGSFLADKVNWPAAFIFYLLFIASVLYFCVYPAFDKGSMTKAIINGAFFGFITYATYDLTNLATLKNWPLPIVFIDIAWGSILTALVSVAGFFILKWII